MHFLSRWTKAEYERETRKCFNVQEYRYHQAKEPTPEFSAWVVGSKSKCFVLIGKLWLQCVCARCPFTRPRLKLHSLLSVFWTLLCSPVLFLVLFSLPRIVPLPPCVAKSYPSFKRANSRAIPLQSLLWSHQSALSTVPATNYHSPLWIPKMLYFYITYDTYHFLLCVATMLHLLHQNISSLRAEVIFRLTCAILP